MINRREIQKTFVRQLGDNDCGMACLCMVLKFAGKITEIATLRAIATTSDASLLDLRNLATESGLLARCVIMDLDFLSTIKTPCILHLGDENDADHFEVCYGTKYSKNESLYLMGDPSRGIHYVSESSLNRRWKSRAALYFDGLSEKPVKQAKSTWHRLFFGSMVPKGLLISIPMLSVFTAILGVAWSWALQRGINSSIAVKENRLIVGIVALLMVVTLAKNVFTYVRQQLMIRVNSTVNKHLMVSLLKTVNNNGMIGLDNNQSFFKNGVTGMMKMQQGVSAFLATILSDGLLIVLVISALLYQSAAVGCINFGYLFLVTFYTIKTFPVLLFENAHLNELSGATEKLILRDMHGISIERSAIKMELAVGFHTDNHSKYLHHAGNLSSAISKNSLLQDCLGTCNVLCVFIYGIVQLRDERIDYNAFMVLVILSYFVTALMPKICSSLFVVSEGIEASRHYEVF